MKITHDFHIHTALSSCAQPSATLESYLAHAKRLGLKKIGFADHYWDEKIPADFLSLNDNVTFNTIPGAPATYDFYTVQNTEHIWDLKKRLEQLTPEQTGDLQIYFGCEAEYDPFHRGLAVSEETAEKLDFIVAASSHTHMMMNRDLYFPWEKHRDFMLQAYEDILNSSLSHRILSMVHPFEICCAPYESSYIMDRMTDDDFKRVFDKTAAKGIAVEINVYNLLQKSGEELMATSKMRMFRIAKECGCKFTFGSDSHTDQVHLHYDDANHVADLLELTDEDIASFCR